MSRILILVGIALFPVLVDAQQEPGIVGDIRPEVKQIFESAYLNCTVVNKIPESLVLWRKVPKGVPYNPYILLISEEETVFRDHYKYHVQIRTVGNRSIYTLEIRYLEESDAGEYMCVLEIFGRKKQDFPRKTGNLTVQSVPVTISLVPTCKSIKSVVDQFTYSRLDAELQCIVTGNPPPTSKWMRGSENGALVEIQDDEKYDITEKYINYREVILSTLLVKNVESVGSVDYVCVGENSHGSARASVRLNKILQPGIVGISEVSSPPEIVGDILPDSKKEGETAYLNCTVANKGYDTAVQWARKEEGGLSSVLTEDANMIYYDPRLSVQIDTNGSKITFMLVIRNLTEVDNGYYSCIVKIYGMDYSDWPEKSTFLVVKFPPKIPWMKSVYNVKFGSSLNIPCEAHGVPSPNMTWEYESGYKYEGIQLTLTNIQKNDRGIYTCVADNGINPAARSDVEIKVFFPPTCTPLSSVVGQAQNRRFDAKMVCEVEGYPEPNVVWIKETNYGRTEIDYDDKYEITKQYDFQLERNTFWSVLKVGNVQANDYGNYECEASNGYGNGSAKITLIETPDCQGADCPRVQ